MKLTKQVIRKVYWPDDPGKWHSLTETAKLLGVSVPELRRGMECFGIKVRTPKDNWKRILWHARQGNNPEHYSNYEEMARRVFEGWGLKPGLDFLHNYQVGTARCDFYFPLVRLCVEIDSVWHSPEWRKFDRSMADVRRDQRLKDGHGVHVIRVEFKTQAEAEEKLTVIWAWIGAAVRMRKVSEL